LFLNYIMDTKKYSKWKINRPEHHSTFLIKFLSF
jgi:hypothetical protein